MRLIGLRGFIVSVPIRVLSLVLVRVRLVRFVPGPMPLVRMVRILCSLSAVDDDAIAEDQLPAVCPISRHETSRHERPHCKKRQKEDQPEVDRTTTHVAPSIARLPRDGAFRAPRVEITIRAWDRDPR
jgi:hypothetical protein